MKMDDFLARPIAYAGRQDELELWGRRSFKQQMQDVFGEASRLVKQHKEAHEGLASQWDTFDSFCMMTYLSPATTEGERKTLMMAEWELYDYIFGDNSFRNTDESVMRWFNQWVFDVNYAALAQG